MQKLPVDDYLPIIGESLKNNSCLVVVAEPGAGKTTRVPAYLLKYFTKKVVVLQPRRVAARASAERVASELSSPLGDVVGYTVRLDSRVSSQTRLEFVTEGVLLQRLLNDPLLKDIDCVILDEFHERSLLADINLALLKECQQLGREDLKVVVMSATIDSESVSQYLNCDVVNVPGRTYPVEIRYSEKPLRLNTDDEFFRQLVLKIAQAMSESHFGDILVFLPGISEIQKTKYKLIEKGITNVIELHGHLSLTEQNNALRPNDSRRIILSTNVAETSLTIESVTVVIDTGLERRNNLNWKTGIETLKLQKISFASAQQRAGRAGRTQSGICYRMWHKQDESSFLKYTPAEVHRRNLSSTLLSLASWGIQSFETFDWFDRPSLESISKSVQELELLGLINELGQLTNLGTKVSHSSIEPRLAIMCEISENKNLAFVISALLMDRDILKSRVDLSHYHSWQSDLELRVNQFEFYNKDIVDVARVEYARSLAKSMGATIFKFDERDWKQISKALIVSHVDRIVRLRKGEKEKGLMSNGIGVQLHSNSVTRNSEYFIALSILDRDSGEDPLVTLAHPVHPDEIKAALADRLQIVNTTSTTGNGSVLIEEHIQIGAVKIGHPKQVKVPKEKLLELFMAECLNNPFETLMKHPEFESWNQRRLFLIEEYPSWDWLKFHRWSDVVENWAYGKSTLQECLQSSPLYFLESIWTHEQMAQFKKFAPAYVDVPSGSRIQIKYETTGPVLSVRLQELFGLEQTPIIGNGKSLKLELLGPNYRPIQITSDLKSFWSNGYREVKKELKARYPKHSWPDNPLTAKPEAKGRRRN